MEGYKYKQNERGVVVPMLQEGEIENEGIVPRSIRLLYELIHQEQGTHSLA